MAKKEKRKDGDAPKVHEEMIKEELRKVAVNSLVASMCVAFAAKLLTKEELKIVVNSWKKQMAKSFEDRHFKNIDYGRIVEEVGKGFIMNVVGTQLKMGGGFE